MSLTRKLLTETTLQNPNIIEEVISKSDNKIRKYIKGKFLGKGGFAKCYEITNMETKKISAAKIISKSSLLKSRAKQKLLSEIKIHRSLSHHNIVNFENYFEDSENVYIILELCKNETMSELIKRRKRLSESEVQTYLLQLLSTLKYLHKNKVIHRDLKLGNLFLSETNEIKLGDFGLAAKLDYEGERRKTICGTPNYIAPEILEGKVGHSYEADLWSLGVIIYTWIIGKPPFETSDVKTTYKKIKMNSYSFPDQANISSNAKNLIQRLIVTKPEQRLTLDEIKDHPFLNSGEICKTYSTENCFNSFNTVKNQNYKGNGGGDNKENNGNLKYSGKIEFNEKKNEDRLKSMEKNILMNKNNDDENLPLPRLTSATRLFSENSKARSNSLYPRTTIVPSQHFLIENVNKLSENDDDIFVKKWVDYSAKYGLGYILSNGNKGAIFNDASKIIYNANEKKYYYIERDLQLKQDVIKHFDNDTYPKTVGKKITLFQYFEKNLGDNIITDKNIKFNGSKENLNLIYVKKWIKAKNAILFRLNTKLVQVIFEDQTQILICTNSKTIIYVNKNGENLKFPMEKALENKNEEFTKRVKYAKEILNQLLNKNKDCNNEKNFEFKNNFFGKLNNNATGGFTNIKLEKISNPSIKSYSNLIQKNISKHS